MRDRMPTCIVLIWGAEHDIARSCGRRTVECAPMKAENRQRKQLRAIGHRLNPVVIVSNGLTEGVVAEIERALTDHELIKIRINAADREEKQELVAAICSKLNAELVQMAGHIALIFRAALKPKPELSNLLRHQELLRG